MAKRVGIVIGIILLIMALCAIGSAILKPAEHRASMTSDIT